MHSKGNVAYSATTRVITQNKVPSEKGEYSKEKDARSGDGVLCVQVHGDGAFSGQVQ